MSPRRSIAAVSAAVLTGGAALILSAPATVNAQESLSPPPAVDVDPAVLAAMERDLGLTTEEALDRLAAEDAALEIEFLAAASLGDEYAGTWITDDGAIAVAATVPFASTLDATGYESLVVDYSLAELETFSADVTAALDRLDGDEIHSWYVDLPGNSIAIVAPDAASAEKVADEAGLADGAWSLTVEADQPVPYQGTIRGGDAYNIAGQSRCSVGFSATHPTYGQGFVTAGHCRIGNGQITGGTGAGGQFRLSQFPGEDWAYVQAGSGWQTSPNVNRYDGTNVQVANGTEAAVGASVCRSGSTTGWYCGVIQAKGVSITYPEGTLTGMTRTSVCAQPGDSGGSYISGNSAQGITSGGAGNCPSGWTVYEPLNRALQRTGATLVTTGGTQPGFNMSVSPSSTNLNPGQSATVTVSTQTTSGSAQTVNLSVSGAPSGVQASLSPTQVTTGGTATLTVNVAASAASGTHTITVTAQGTVTRTATLTLVIGGGGGGETTWQTGTAYQVGAQVVYNGVQYRCTIAHTSQSTWTPDVTPALWARA
ncbi:carbohydrate-binding protein [Glycomyces sp. NPDC046736]|uniref:carbohydrate-binding protein n=1 Tax=Glycomyces sp. NPDC046736 TaxID=3155615 RepID=UPI0033D93183